MAELTPMMQQYLETKKQYPDCILFYRLGDFYEMFFDDALTASKELEITLTGKNCGLEERAPMCGVPYHAVESYLDRLVSKGYKVAICEQMEDPKLAKGLVKRDVVRIVTPGTNLDVQALEESKNNYLMCVAYFTGKTGLSIADVTTGDYYVTEVEDAKKLLDEINKYHPSEIICNDAEERIVSGTVQEIAEKIFAPLAVLVVKREKTADDIGNDTVSTKKDSENSVTGSCWRERAKTHGPGLLDDWFVRGEVPMTKQEVRAAALAKLGAAGAKVLYDVGAGTGSVSVELSLMAGQADVYAIECEEKAVELIGKNRERFGCGNLHVVFGKAPQALDSLPAPDAVFIGGTKGNLPEILSILFEKNPSVRIVVTAILLETALQACESLEAFTLKPAEIMQLQVSRSKKAGKGHMLCANNPIFLISAGGCADE